MRGPSSRGRSRRARFATAIRRVGLRQTSGLSYAGLRARRPRPVQGAVLGAFAGVSLSRQRPDGLVGHGRPHACESQRVRSTTFLVRRCRVTFAAAGPARGAVDRALIAKARGRRSLGRTALTHPRWLQVSSRLKTFSAVPAEEGRCRTSTSP